jgi:hypothetical protein
VLLSFGLMQKKQKKNFAILETPIDSSKGKSVLLKKSGRQSERDE